jgi:hypothetical protein
MPDTDSPLFTTSSVISIITLVYAVAITLRIYAKALSQCDRDLEALIQRFEFSEYGLREVQAVMVGFEQRRSDYIFNHDNSAADMRVLKSKLDNAAAKGKGCVEDWRKMQSFHKASDPGDYLPAVGF